MPQWMNMRTATVSAAVNGSNPIVAAPGTTNLNPGKTQAVGGLQVGSVTVWAFSLEGAGANTLQFQSNATNLGGPITFTGAGATAFYPYTGAPYFKTAAGEPLNLTLGTTALITGSLQYSLG